MGDAYSLIISLLQIGAIIYASIRVSDKLWELRHSSTQYPMINRPKGRFFHTIFAHAGRNRRPLRRRKEHMKKEFLTNFKVNGQKLPQYRLEQPEKKVQAHNNLVEHAYKLEGEMRRIAERTLASGE